MIDLNMIDLCELEMERTELIGFLAGVKPAVINMVENPELIKTRLTQLSPGKKLYFAETSLRTMRRERTWLGENGPILNQEGGQKWLAISRDKKTVEKLAKSFSDADREEVGRLLGYPECCVKQCRSGTPTVQNISGRTRGRPVFYANNLFNLQTRLVGNDGRNINRLAEKNRKIGGYAVYLISHIPCSYDCKMSIDIGKRTLKALKTVDRALKIPIREETILKKPVLFLDNFNWIVFNGRVEEHGALLYSSISWPRSLIKEGTVRKIEAGDRLYLKNNEIAIFKNNTLISRLDLKGFDPVILDFSQEYSHGTPELRAENLPLKCSHPDSVQP